MYRRLDVMRGRLELLGLGHEAHTPRMARRLADGDDPRALIALLELLEPVSFGERARLQPLVQQTPLVFAVDAARPDPPAHWETRALVAAVASNDGKARGALDSMFTAWRALAPAIDSLAGREPLVRDAVPAAQALARVAAIGQDYLGQLGRGPVPPEWIKARLAELDGLAKPQGLLRVTVLPAIRQLLESGTK
jgi:hypothetical protein